MSDQRRITVERDGSVLLIGFDRVEKRNAADHLMLEQLAAAYGELEHDPDLRCGFVFAHGDHFTGGLDSRMWGRASDRRGSISCRPAASTPGRSRERS